MAVQLTSKRVGSGIAAAAIVALASAPVLAQTASAVLREGDTIAAGVTVTGIDAPANNGVQGYAFGVIASDTLDRFYGNATGGAPAILRTEGTFGPFTQTAFEASFGIADSGAISYGPTVNDTVGGFNGLDSVWVDNTVVLNQRDPIPGLPGQFSTFNSDPQITYNGIPYWVGGFSSTQGGATQNRALFRGTNATPLIKGGDLIPLAGAPMSTTASSFGARLSALGTNFIYSPQFGAPATTSNDTGIVVNGDLFVAGGGVVREGSPVPASVGGLPGENWANFDAAAINEAGQVFFTGDTSAAIAVDEFVFVNNSIVLREGAVLTSSLGPAIINGAIEWGDANETLDWAVTWDVDAGGSNREALIVNGQIALLEGDLVDWNGDGLIDASDNNGRLADFTGIRSLSVGERQLSSGVPVFDVLFTADIDFNGTTSTTDDLEGGFRIQVVVPEPSMLGLAGAAGVMLIRRRPRRARCNTTKIEFRCT